MTKDLDMIQHTGNEAVRLLAELQKTPHPANQAAQSPVQKPDLAAPVFTYAGRRYELNGTVPIRKVVRSGCLNFAPLCSLHQFEP